MIFDPADLLTHISNYSLCMHVKIDTREKFHVITVLEPQLAANMTAELENSLIPFLQNGVKNLVVIVKDIKFMDKAAAECLVDLQQRFYDCGASLVICQLDPKVETALDDSGILEWLNVAPTESEAIDIVQLEEIERELQDGEELNT